MTNYSVPPTDDDIIATFTSFAAERAKAGVLLAKAVAEVSVHDDRVTVVIDPVRSGAEYWALVETSPYDNLADLFGTPAAFDDEQGIWLRTRVAVVVVRDVDSRPLGERTTADLNDRATGRD